MDNHHDRLELLISRKLDGLLSEDESYELDKLLIRDPQARRLLDESTRLEACAGVLLEEICDPPALSADAVRSMTSRRRGWRRRLMWPAALGAAACLGWAVLLIQAPSHPLADTRAPDAIEYPDAAATSDSWMQFAGSPAVQERGTQVDYYGVLDEDSDALYLLKFEHTQERRRPAEFEPGTVRLASGEM